MRPVLAVIAGILALFSAGLVNGRDLPVKFERGYDFGPEKVVIAYKQAMVEMMRFQEEKFGISYDAVPNLKFAKLPKNILPGLTITIEGMYQSLEKVIYLNDFFEDCSAPLMPKQFKDLTGLMSFHYPGPDWWGGRCNWGYIRAILAHELGHAYMDQLSQRMNNDSWPPLFRIDDASGMRRYLGMRLVSEGVAEYLWRTLGGVGDDFSDFEWGVMAKDKNGTNYPYITRAGFHFVKPILDRFGERGIKYLIKNPLVIDKSDLTQMPKIQLLIMLTLRAENISE